MPSLPHHGEGTHQAFPRLSPCFGRSSAIPESRYLTNKLTHPAPAQEPEERGGTRQLLMAAAALSGTRGTGWSEQKSTGHAVRCARGTVVGSCLQRRLRRGKGKVEVGCVDGEVSGADAGGSWTCSLPLPALQGAKFLTYFEAPKPRPWKFPDGSEAEAVGAAACRRLPICRLGLWG